MLYPTRVNNSSSFHNSSYFFSFNYIKKILINQSSSVVQIFFGLFIRSKFKKFFCKLVKFKIKWASFSCLLSDLVKKSLKLDLFSSSISVIFLFCFLTDRNKLFIFLAYSNCFQEPFGLLITVGWNPIIDSSCVGCSSCCSNTSWLFSIISFWDGSTVSSFWSEI